MATNQCALCFIFIFIECSESVLQGEPVETELRVVWTVPMVGMRQEAC